MASEKTSNDKNKKSKYPKKVSAKESRKFGGLSIGKTVFCGLTAILLIVLVVVLLVKNINKSNDYATTESTPSVNETKAIEHSPVYLNFTGSGLWGAPEEKISIVGDREITEINLPIWCSFDYPYYIDSSAKVKSHYTSHTQYEGMATSSLSDYGVTTCRTEAYVKYRADEGIKLADSNKSSGEKYVELKPEENRFIVWRFWNHFADKSSVPAETETVADKTNKIITFVNEQGEVVKTFILQLSPIIVDNDFFNSWKEAIDSKSKNTKKIETKRTYDLDYYKGSDEIWYGDGSK